MLPFENARHIKTALNMKDTFSTKYCFYWDEICRMGLRFYQAGVNVVWLDPMMIADIDQKFKYFSVFRKSGKWRFSWDNETLDGYNGRYERIEFSHAYFQKRKLSVVSGDILDSELCIVPNRVINRCAYSSEISPETILYTMNNRINYYKKRSKEQRDKDMQLKMAWEETSRYCIEHGLL